MHKILYLFLVFLITQSAVGQNFDVKLFNGKTKRTKDQLQSNMQEYRKIRKENLDYIKQRKKKYKAMKDSLKTFNASNPNISADSLAYLQKLQKKHFLFTDSLYSIQSMASWDSLKKVQKESAVNLAEEKLSGNEYFEGYKSLQGQIGSYRKEVKDYRDSLKSLDNLSKEEVKSLVILKRQELSKKYESDLESITKDIVIQKAPNLPSGFENQHLNQFKQANHHLMNPPDKSQLMSKVQSQDYFKGKTEVLDKAKTDIAELKEKYAKVPDSNDLKNAVKVNSLQEKPMAERFVFGGNFQLHIDNNTSIDISPEIAYRVNKQFDIGVGGTYRVNVATEDLVNTIQEKQVIGYRGFAEHLLFNMFYGHLELEALKGTFESNDDEFNEWNYSILAGIERRFSLHGNVQGQVSVLYNFMHASNPLYNSPWSFRFGFNVNGSKK